MNSRLDGYIPTMVMAAVVSFIIYAAVADDGAPAAEPATEPAGMAALVAELESAGADWAAEKPADPLLERKLRSITCDEAYVSGLAAAATRKRDEPVGAYVAHRLLEPLLAAKTDIIRQAVPAIRQIMAAVDCKEFPRCTDSELSSLKMPDKMPSDPREAARITDAVNKARDKKIARERPIMLHNTQAGRVQRTGFELLVLAAQDDVDRDLIERIEKAERAGDYRFAEILEAARAEAVRMDEGRAKMFYERLKTLGLKLGDKRGEYTDRSRAAVSKTENTRFESRREQPGALILKAVNHFATAAKMPAVVVPFDRQPFPGRRPGPR